MDDEGWLPKQACLASRNLAAIASIATTRASRPSVHRCRPHTRPQQPSNMLLRCVVALSCLSAAAGLQLPMQAKSTRRAVLEAASRRTATRPEDEILHVVDYPKQGFCGEALVPDKGVPFVKAFGGLSSGTCESAGYPNREGTANGTGDKDSDREYTIYGK